MILGGKQPDWDGEKKTSEISNRGALCHFETVATFSLSLIFNRPFNLLLQPVIFGGEMRDDGRFTTNSFVVSLHSSCEPCHLFD